MQQKEVLANYVWNAQVKLPHCLIGKHEKVKRYERKDP